MREPGFHYRPWLLLVAGSESSEKLVPCHLPNPQQKCLTGCVLHFTFQIGPSLRRLHPSLLLHSAAQTRRIHRIFNEWSCFSVQIIRTATRDGTLSTTDWDTKPYPSVVTTPALSRAKAGPSERKSRWEPEPQASVAVEKKSRWDREKNGAANGHPGLLSQLGQKKSKNMLWVRGQSPDKGAKSSTKSPRGKKRGRRGGVVETKETRGSSSSESDGAAGPRKKGLGKPTAEEVNRRERRSRRFDGLDGKKGRRRQDPVAGEASLRKDRAAMLMAAAGQGAAEDIDWSTMTVKGTCQTVEKRFLRLTAAPDPSTVSGWGVVEDVRGDCSGCL